MARVPTAGSLKGGRSRRAYGTHTKARTRKDKRAVIDRYGAVRLIDAELLPLGLSYTVLVSRLKSVGVEPDPVMLASLARKDRPKFLKVVRLASGSAESEAGSRPRAKVKGEGRIVTRPAASELRDRKLPPRVSIPDLMARVRAVVVAGAEGDSVSVIEADAVVEAVCGRLPDFADPTQTLGPYYDTGGLRRRLGGVKRQALEGRRRRNTLLAVEADDGSLLYPTWQFTKDFGVVEGLPAVLRELGKVAEDGFSKAVWLTTPQDVLGGRTAAEWLSERGDPERVRVAAESDVRRLLA